MQSSPYIAIDRNAGESHGGNIIFALSVSIILFALMSYYFNYEYRPDEIKALPYFFEFFGSDYGYDELYIRVILYIFNIGLTFSLFLMGWIDRKTLTLALIWPLTIFLFSKIYWEFYVFPFALIRIDGDKKLDFAVLITLSVLYLLFQEGNIVLMIAFRLVILGQKFGYKYLSPIAFALFGVLAGIAVELGIFSSLPLVGQQIARFSWTRDVANPDYSLIESITVFFTSFHFFTQHYLLWWIDFVFSILVSLYIMIFCLSKKSIRENMPQILAFIAVFVGFTELTHVFQNARYYFFFIPVLSLFINSKDMVPLSLLGILHVTAKGIETGI
ncbi:hypothetical protein [Pelagibacterium halotolerans]|uniref:Uncharacterized protein n=1 Tax=Pelagibacterium halotolerans (strain DSM 22347 / JCM 15775 / CGMCC 1.7692 / B2) TaxID=1082931 RepID=G4RGW0_PELHB|nr:hypothetical protein [Pelagibacterium halotolerans]AEQ53113.1 hypothetical protein KKY_3123 [Pelagibacterium halotolerans B2]QJR17246.1 hypothetical protein HKM20_01470 [Pelagibacterium halotolerans]SEA98858.1 hypothetical protein SAMN05428936_11813 [Pelagibacterium halotolerans]